MKYFLFLLTALAKEPTVYIQKFCYPDRNLKVVVDSDSKDEGMKKAANVCFQTLTKGKYPGEEEGLDIIDICANPKRCD
jgi:hypothetical protein